HGMCTRAERAAHARLFLEKVGLWDEVKDRLHERATRLSGGQQQRLCLARTLANRPQAILMDEPCSALDPHATRRIEEHIADLRTEYPVVVVTHNLGQARRISDQPLILTEGRVVEGGPPIGFSRRRRASSRAISCPAGSGDVLALNYLAGMASMRCSKPLN